MEIKLEIGENLRGAIEEIAGKIGTEEDLGQIIQNAFGIDFSKLIKEHAEGGDVRLEAKEISKLTDYTKLKCALVPLIGIEYISDEAVHTLLVIAKGMYWNAKTGSKVRELKQEINKELRSMINK